MRARMCRLAGSPALTDMHWRPPGLPGAASAGQHLYLAPVRKIIIAVVVLLAAHVALLLAGAGRGNASLARSGTTVGIVFDVGGRGDKSFNDGAYAGADSARRMLGVTVRYIEPGDGSDRESGLRLLAAEKMDLVMGVGLDRKS